MATRAPWKRDVLVEHGPHLDTTGGKVWIAAHTLCDFFEDRQEGLGLCGGEGRALHALEIGAGCGWLGICLARNVPGLSVVLTEQEAGLAHLERNIEVNRAAGIPLDGVSVAALDWSDRAGYEALLSSRPWDIVFGSDLLYNQGGLLGLPPLFHCAAGPSTRVIYSHTLHRYDHLDLELFKGLAATGIEAAEVGAEPPGDEAFLEELFPEERPAVLELARTAAGERRQPPLRPPAADAPRHAAASRAAAKEAAAQEVQEEEPEPLPIRVLLPDGQLAEGQGDTGGPGVPVVCLAILGPFGNATHPTTRVVLRWLGGAEGRAALAGAAVCDYGCGSGILGIGAIRLGASSCAATDIEPPSLQATTTNAVANDVALRVHLPPENELDRDLDFYSRFGDWRAQEPWRPLPAECDGSFDVVLCNIVPGPLCRVASTLRRLCKPGGWVVLAGFKRGHFAKQVEAAYSPHFALTDAGGEQGWGLFVGRG